PKHIKGDVVLERPNRGDGPVLRLRRDDGQRREPGVADAALAKRGELVVDQLLAEHDVSLATGAVLDDFMAQVVLEPQPDARLVHDGLPHRCVVHPPRDVSLGRETLPRTRPILLEVAARNIAAETPA